MHTHLHHHTAACSLLLLAGAALLASCAADDDLTADPAHRLQLASLGNSVLSSSATPALPYGAPLFRTPEGEQRAPHRAPTPGSFIPGTGSGADLTNVPSFVPYNYLYPVPINKDYTTIGAFLTDAQHTSYNSPSGYFRYRDENTWDTTVGIKPGDFWLYGYMPSNTGSTSATIERTGASWAEGCLMTINNISTVTPADVCVVTGVLKAEGDGFDSHAPWAINDATNVVPHLSQGKYDYRGEETGNFVYLLLDHLYTNVNLELSLDPDYAELRTIVLKTVYMKSSASSTISIKLNLTNDPVNPIKNLKFIEPSDQATVNAKLFPDAEQYATRVSADPANPTSIPGYFAPGQTTQSFQFEFVYDVYDRKGIDADHPYGHLVRKDCHAINRWTLGGTTVTSGKSFKVTARIIPTYLYQLSEADLDNPTFEFSAPEGTTIELISNGTTLPDVLPGETL